MANRQEAKNVGRQRQWAADRALRPAMRSPGRPEPSRSVQRQFWRLIAQGVSTDDAAAEVGVSAPVEYGGQVDILGNGHRVVPLLE